jgi:flagellar basal body-associated protein FliL
MKDEAENLEEAAKERNCLAGSKKCIIISVCAVIVILGIGLGVYFVVSK